MRQEAGQDTQVPLRFADNYRGPSFIVDVKLITNGPQGTRCSCAKRSRNEIWWLCRVDINDDAAGCAISTTGAATVQFQWELTGSATNTSVPQALAFTGAGTQNVAGPAALGIDCGNYTIALHVTSPSDISASKAFTVANP